MSLNGLNETLLNSQHGTALGDVVLRCYQGIGRERTQGSTEGCLLLALHKGQQTDFRETGAPGKAVREDRGAKWEPWVGGGPGLLGVSMTWPGWRRGGQQ